MDPTFPNLDLSPDGSLLVYLGGDGAGPPQLWLRRWDELNATPIRGTEDAAHPAISPEGLEVAFDQGGAIRIVPLQGGGPRTLIEVGNSQPVWSPDGEWVYFRNGLGLSRIPAAGGEEEIITEVNRAGGEDGHAFVIVLPGGRKILYQVLALAAEPSIRALDLETGQDKVLTLGGYPRFSSTGHLLFLDDTATLLAAPFDVEKLELTGAARPLAEQLLMFSNGMGFFKVSEAGKLVYVTEGGGVAGPGRLATPVWVERDGTAREIDPLWGLTGVPSNSGPVLSPSGARLALSIMNPEGGSDVWVKPLDTGPLLRLTFEGRVNIRTRWSPDGQSLTFLSNRAGNFDIWTKRADGSDTPELVLDLEAPIWDALYSPDSTWLVFREGQDAAADIYAARLPLDGVLVPLVVTEFQEWAFSLSPNRRWLAYVSNRSGRDEVYVRPFPDAGASLHQVSTNGGREPVWAHSGRELFYVNGANELVAVQVSSDPGFAPGQQEVLFSVAAYLRNPAVAMYDVSPADRRFVMFRFDDDGPVASELIWVENWAEELRQRVPN